MAILKALDIAVLFCRLWLNLFKELSLAVGQIILIFFQLPLFFVARNIALVIIFLMSDSFKNLKKGETLVTRKLQSVSIRVASVAGIILILAGMTGLVIGKDENKVCSLFFSLIGFILISGCFYQKLTLMNKKG